MTYCFSSELEGIDARIVRVEVNMKKGIPRFQIVGLATPTVREASERVRIAIENSGFEFPLRSVLVNLSPAGSKKEGTWFDLSIATCILRLNQQVHPKLDLNSVLILGELGLDGTIKPMRGISSILFHTDEKKFPYVILPKENALEASISNRFTLFPISHLTELVEILENKKESFSFQFIRDYNRKKLGTVELFQDQLPTLRTLQISVSGRHHALLMGSPGAGKSMLAYLADSIQPELSSREFEEVLKIKSSVELLSTIKSIQLKRPFRAPHHTSSDISLVGGGKNLRVGEVSLAHNGILFLDELGEFKPSVIQALREPMEEGKIVISRVNYHATFPAGITLIAATNPCPCGYYGSEIKACICSPQRIEKYRARLSGPFLDRLDLILEVFPSKPEYRKKVIIDLDELKFRADKARLIQEERYKHTDFRFNGNLSGTRIDSFLEFHPVAKKIADSLYLKRELSLRKINKIKKVARTIADITESTLIEEEHILESIGFSKLTEYSLRLAA
ncbi:MAG: YifB family Mg chelatase-like AAA ATPase [Leptospiraceae bacterium]|nr:YifB family Mg chelatase-like AAA ATPase [Leptospiraceae bacterium]